MSLTVRPALPEDHAHLVTFTEAVAMETEGRKLARRVVSDAVMAALRDPMRARYFVAEDEEEGMVGSLFVTYEWSDWTGGWYWWVQAAYVDPDMRGRGIYRMMTEAVLREARLEGDVREVRLYVDDGNMAGLAAHAAVGFLPTDYVIMHIPV